MFWYVFKTILAHGFPASTGGIGMYCVRICPYFCMYLLVLSDCICVWHVFVRIGVFGIVVPNMYWIMYWYVLTCIDVCIGRYWHVFTRWLAQEAWKFQLAVTLSSHLPPKPRATVAYCIRHTSEDPKEPQAGWLSRSCPPTAWCRVVFARIGMYLYVYYRIDLLCCSITPPCTYWSMYWCVLSCIGMYW